MVQLAKKPYAYQELSDLPIKKKRVQVKLLLCYKPLWTLSFTRQKGSILALKIWRYINMMSASSVMIFFILTPVSLILTLWGETRCCTLSGPAVKDLKTAGVRERRPLLQKAPRCTQFSSIQWAISEWLLSVSKRILVQNLSYGIEFEFAGQWTYKKMSFHFYILSIIMKVVHQDSQFANLFTLILVAQISLNITKSEKLRNIKSHHITIITSSSKAPISRNCDIALCTAIEQNKCPSQKHSTHWSWQKPGGSRVSFTLPTTGMSRYILKTLVIICRVC